MSVPFGGLLVPIIIWRLKKDKIPGIDIHGRIVANWVLSTLIYSIVSILLCFVLVGFVLIAALAIMDLIFPIIGGIKANNGQVWRYPLSIRFFKYRTA
ncbi:MAG: DUF4870 domain-containing protein [Sedimentisphaerales bacterium]|nr:DUF4870 domain-containing protein [Sedimentisphaerales bacterium]